MSNTNPTNPPLALIDEPLAQNEAAPQENSPNAFALLGLNPDIVRALLDVGFTAPTPVQAKAIPAFLAGRDLLVSSQTGSGKTAAFMLPALHKIASLPMDEELAQTRLAMDEHQRRFAGPGGRGAGGKHRRFNGHASSKGGLKAPSGGAGLVGGKFAPKRPRGPAQPSVLVLTPTRELAEQVTAATRDFGRYLRHIEVASILGGMPYPKQLDMLARMPDILVATPGRLLDHMNAGRIDLSKLAMMVFDEADRMLDMGFQEDIEQILSGTPSTRQTLMFSATLDGQVVSLAQRMLNNPERIAIKQSKQEQANIEQRVHYTDDLGHKYRLLDQVLRDVGLKQAIIFTATKRDADALAQQLADDGFAAGALHGDMNQGARNRTLALLRNGKMQVLVATDVAARGIDVPEISHVVNFDLPKQAEDYVHRIGRTGRAGRSGIAISLVNHAEAYNWRRIEGFINKRVEPTVIEGFEPRRAAPKFTPKPPPGQRARSYNSRGYGGGGGGSYGGGGGYGGRRGGDSAARSWRDGREAGRETGREMGREWSARAPTPHHGAAHHSAGATPTAPSYNAADRGGAPYAKPTQSRAAPGVRGTIRIDKSRKPHVAAGRGWR